MKTDLELAIEQLKEGTYTCVLRKGNCVYTSTQRGVKPLLAWLAIKEEQNQSAKTSTIKLECNEEVDVPSKRDDFAESAAADKVVGKAAAMLYVLLGVKNVYAEVISSRAKAVLEQYEIAVSYDLCVDRIHNRTNTGFCPMEEAVWEIENLTEALQAVKAKVAVLAEREKGEAK